MIRGRFMRSLDDCSDVFSLRREVFVDELGMPESCVKDDLDQMAVYALVFNEEGTPAGTGRLAIDDDRFMLGRICVLTSERGQRLGDLVMRMLLVRVQEMGAPSVYVSALLPAVGFYQRYGFKAIGEVYDEEGQPHRLMRALAEEIDIEGDCKKDKTSCKDCVSDCGDCPSNS